MKFSIIIPVHNSQDTIRPCLDAVYSSLNKDFELIVVDDKSTDSTASLVKGYPCSLISLEKNRGAAFARNAGVSRAGGRILLFIDSDVLIKDDTLDIIDKAFEEDSGLAGVTGLLSVSCPHSNFFSQYKNLYMHYVFKRCPKYVSFLYGSIMAIRKEEFLPFNETYKITDDTELGQRYKDLNKEIALVGGLEVVHLKKYSPAGIIRNDFFVPFWWAKSFIAHKGLRDIFKEKRFSHAGMPQLITIGLSYLFICSLLFTGEYRGAVFIAFLIMYFFLNFDYFLFLRKEKGGFFLLQSIGFMFIDSLIMGLGAITGIFYFSIGTRLRKGAAGT